MTTDMAIVFAVPALPVVGAICAAIDWYFHRPTGRHH